MNEAQKILATDEQNLLIKLYSNRMEQSMNRGDREAAVIYMEAMYETIRVRNEALMVRKARFVEA
jgi:hypothetical protein